MRSFWQSITEIRRAGCRGHEWDTVMNYDAFMEPLTWFLTGMEKHSDECRMTFMETVMPLLGL